VAWKKETGSGQVVEQSESLDRQNIIIEQGAKIIQTLNNPGKANELTLHNIIIKTLSFPLRKSFINFVKYACKDLKKFIVLGFDLNSPKEP
jgi:hypothetical protein